MEGVAQRMNELDTSELCGSVCRALRRSKPSSPNIIKVERVVLRTLKEKDSIVILPADKGNAK